MGNSASACVARLKLASTGLLEAWQWFFREQASDLIMTNGDLSDMNGNINKLGVSGNGEGEP